MDMLEIYCDSSFNEGGSSFIGCFIIKDGVEVHQSTTRILPDPIRNLECETAAIRFAIAQAAHFSGGSQAVIYNDSTEAVKEFQARKIADITIEFISRNDPRQSVADRLSKKFSHARIETLYLCKKPVETFTPEILQDIANGRPVLYLLRDMRESTNSKTVYRLVIRTAKGVISDGRTYTAKSGEVKNIKVAREISRDFGNPGFFNTVTLDDPYFLLTDETWGLRLKGGEAYSILPCSIPHRIICHEVDRTAENLFNRILPYTDKR